MNLSLLGDETDEGFNEELEGLLTFRRRLRFFVGECVVSMLLLLLFEGWMPPSLSLSLPPQHNNIKTTTPTQTT